MDGRASEPLDEDAGKSAGQAPDALARARAFPAPQTRQVSPEPYKPGAVPFVGRSCAAERPVLQAASPLALPPALEPTGSALPVLEARPEPAVGPADALAHSEVQ